MSVKLSVVVENDALEGMKTEHGFSVLLETQNNKILFDLGQGKAFFHNLEFMGLSLSSLDAVVLSHGHYDHGDGLAVFFEKLGRFPVFAHKDVFTSRYSFHSGEKPKYIGLSEEVKKELKDNIIVTNKITEIKEGIFVTGEVPRITDYEDTGGDFYLDKERKQKDLLKDDMSLFFDTEKGLVILSGCAHSGIINIIEHIKNFMPKRPIYAVLGGFHLVNADDNRIEKTCAALLENKVEFIAPVHCTGEKAIKRLSQDFKNRVLPFSGGAKVTFPIL